MLILDVFCIMKLPKPQTQYFSNRIVSKGANLYNFPCSMPDEYLETQGELTGDLNPKKKKKKRHWWEVAIEVLMFGVIGCIAVVSANILYLKCSYGYAFFVDGVSMYPTLNGDGLRLNSDGSYSKLTWYERTGQQHAGDYVDYGWAKMGETGISELKRFDIVITYFSKDMEQQSDGSYAAKKDASLKVKRLIAFPGETVELKPDLDADGNLTTPWGTLIITSAEGEVSVYPSYYTFDDYPDVDGVSYRSQLTKGNQIYGPLKLDDHSYFVLGDNRASHFSSDSRTEGNYVYDYCLQGKAYVITSLRKLKKSGNTFTPEFDLGKVRPFWNYNYLDNSPIANTRQEASSDA